ncbi:MAG: PRC-barrel domain-containing protein [Gluconacetobacter diazotrophicus]|nr:PRC-barrel domain-containing protein [Gluconacetobacter diazotrophicus]
MTAAFTRYVDVAQVALYIFWAFFAGLILYLQRESKREGYPLVGEAQQRFIRGPVEGFPPTPSPKAFHKPDGTTSYAPETIPPDGPLVNAVPVANFPGAPIEPTGNPLVDGIGPAAWCKRSTEPDKLYDGENRMAPLRHAEAFTVARRSDDPTGWDVVGADGVVAGSVSDVWIDRGERTVTYFEVVLNPAIHPEARHVLVPERYVRLRPRRRQLSVRAILAHQFRDIPVLSRPDQVSFREEDQLVGYFGGGGLYATPNRLGPLL